MQDHYEFYDILNNRQITTVFQPIVTLSIAVITNKIQQPADIDALSESISTTKKRCKQQQGNTILIV